MLYTIVSRIPVFVNDKSSRKYAKIFMIGAICYILIHYLLFSFCKGELANKLKNYIYYIIIVDAGIAYLLDKVLAVTDSEDKSPFVKKTKTTDESEHKNKTKSKVEEIKEEKQECKDCKDGICKLPEKKKEKTSDSETSESSKKKEKKKTETEKDTEIPSYHV